MANEVVIAVDLDQVGTATDTIRPGSLGLFCLAMHSLSFIRVLGICLLLFSGALLLPIAVSLVYQDHEVLHFSLTLLASLLLGLALWLPTAGQSLRLRKLDGFIVVIMLWVITSMLGSFPFYFGLKMGLADAVFESVSAFTTTGSTVITGLDALPKSILFFRQEMQWLGGIGVVVSAIALLPMLGIGGMQLFKAESPRPIKDEKLAPRIGRTAQIMWKLYLAMTFACAMLYWSGGMSLFDAVAHSFSTVSTGGFSTHDANLGFFNSAFSAVATCINNLGPGFGEVATNFASVSDAGKWVLSFTMLLGRLEIMSVLVLLMPNFWNS